MTRIVAASWKMDAELTGEQCQKQKTALRSSRRAVNQVILSDFKKSIFVFG
jgi:hypothetical protein